MYFCASAKTCVANAEYVEPDDLIVDVGGSRMKGAVAPACNDGWIIGCVPAK
jgi:hypothetical protein